MRRRHCHPGELYTAEYAAGSWAGGASTRSSVSSISRSKPSRPISLTLIAVPRFSGFPARSSRWILATGKVRWDFQGVHIDLWDRDMPAQPTLVDLTVAGATVPALIAPTKQGDVYVLDRRTGKPIFPVRELPEPKSTVPGERISATQPSSALSFMPPPLTGSDMWGATPFDQLVCRIEFHSMGYDGPYTPPATRRTLVYPGNAGVFNWGGVAVDPVRQVMVATPVRLAFTYQLIPRHDPTTSTSAQARTSTGTRITAAATRSRSGPFMSPIGLPCQQPPWGAIAGADLGTGKLAWMHRNGTVRDQMPRFLPIPFPMGVASLGGPLITAGGVAFYSGTLDNYLRAYDVTTGASSGKRVCPRADKRRR